MRKTRRKLSKTRRKLVDKGRNQVDKRRKLVDKRRKVAKNRQKQEKLETKPHRSLRCQTSCQPSWRWRFQRSRPSRLTLLAFLLASSTTTTPPSRRRTMRHASNPSSSRRAARRSLGGPSGTIRLGPHPRMTRSSNTIEEWPCVASPSASTNTQPTILQSLRSPRPLSRCRLAFGLTGPL